MSSQIVRAYLHQRVYLITTKTVRTLFACVQEFVWSIKKVCSILEHIKKYVFNYWSHKKLCVQSLSAWKNMCSIPGHIKKCVFNSWWHKKICVQSPIIENMCSVCDHRKSKENMWPVFAPDIMHQLEPLLFFALSNISGWGCGFARLS